MRDLENRADVSLLIHSFYAKIRKDDVLGPIFHKVIGTEEHIWDIHLEKLTDFWETNLFFKAIYKGNPLKAHQDVDNEMKGTIKQAHFGEWLNYWVNTIDELFEGERADLAKKRAKNMATLMFMKIFENRKKKPTTQL